LKGEKQSERKTKLKSEKQNSGMSSRWSARGEDGG
jgi:hypothetical protein